MPFFIPVLYVAGAAAAALLLSGCSEDESEDSNSTAAETTKSSTPVNPGTSTQNNTSADKKPASPSGLSQESIDAFQTYKFQKAHAHLKELERMANPMNPPPSLSIDEILAWKGEKSVATEGEKSIATEEKPKKTVHRNISTSRVSGTAVRSSPTAVRSSPTAVRSSPKAVKISPPKIKSYSVSSFGLNFGNVKANSNSFSKTFTVRNTGTERVNFSLSAPPHFYVSPGVFMVGPKFSQTVSVHFTAPMYEGSYSGTITISAWGASGSGGVSVSGSSVKH